MRPLDPGRSDNLSQIEFQSISGKGTLTWLDTSEKDRRGTLEFIDTLRERDVRDELGIGVVRDASSDLMFPGTSTVQTRAKYFLLVPWCYLKAVDYARRTSAARDKLDTFTRDREISLMRPLEAGGDVMGLLGRDAKQGLTQQPSAISRQGLGTWGIRRFAGSRA